MSRSRRITFQAGDAVELTFDSQPARSGSYGAYAPADSSSYYRPSFGTRPAEGTRVFGGARPKGDADEAQ